MNKKFDLEFQGYWKEIDTALATSEPGVLVAYACDYDRVLGRLQPTRILRIEDTNSARDTIESYAKNRELQTHLIEGEHVCFAFAPLLFGREQAAAALIYRHKPIGNHEHKYSFRYQPIEIRTRGQNSRLQASFVSPDPEDKEVSHLLERLGFSMSA